MMEKMICLENVVKMYGRGCRALNGVSFSMHEHERANIYGVSGSGKSTLIKLIMGIETPSAGSIFVNGREMHSIDNDTAADFRNDTFGILPRKCGFMNHLTILENITMPLTIRKTSAKQRNKAADEQLETMGIRHIQNAYPFQLSVREAILASLARALISQPKILLIDEVEADLTPKELEQIKGMIHAAWQCSEITLLRFTDRKNDDWSTDFEYSLTLKNGKIGEI